MNHNCRYRIEGICMQESALRHIQTAFIALFLMVGVRPCLFAQMPLAPSSPINGENLTPQAGEGHDYVQLLSETVDPSSGSVNLQIGIPTPSSRGISLPFAINYSSSSASHLDFCYIDPTWNTFASSFGQGGWSYGVPTASISNWFEDTESYGRFFHSGSPAFTDLSGKSHTVGAYSEMSPGYSDINEPALPYYWTDGHVWSSVAWTHSPSSDNLHNGQFIAGDDHGNVYNFTDHSMNDSLRIKRYTCGEQGTDVEISKTIEDRNGNIMSFSYTQSSDHSTGNWGQTECSPS